MTHLLYTHSPNVPLVTLMTSWIRHILPVSLLDPPSETPRRVWPRRILILIGWLLAVSVQFGLLWLVAELVSVAHGLMELWLQLANQQLDLVSLYNAVRPAK